LIDLDREREFYDSQYAQFLELPDHALRTDRGILEGNLANPAHPFFERRRLYSAALHHTLKYPGAVEELARVMKPGARLVLCETWGGNPLLNGARWLRARVAGEVEEQGEGIILSRRELKALDGHFAGLRVETLSLFAMGKRLLRGRFGSAWARGMVGALEAVDAGLLAMAPPLHEWCGEAVITARRK
jgi:hypothetical protein